MGSGEGTGEGKGTGKGGCAACSEGCVHCARVTLIIFNSIFLIVGLAVLGVGIWLVADPNVSSILAIAGGAGNSNIIRVVAYIFLATGGLIFLVSLFGIIGASRWNKCLLATYIAFITILICAQIAVVILGFVASREIGDALKDGMKDFIRTSYDETDNALSNSWRRLMATRECCGVDGYQDWQTLDTAWYRNTGQPTNWNWPKQCCKLQDQTNPDSNPDNETACRAGTASAVSQRGCYDQMESFLRRYVFAIGGAFIGIFLLQVLVLIFASIVHRGLVVYEYEMNNIKPHGQVV